MLGLLWGLVVLLVALWALGLAFHIAGLSLKPMPGTGLEPVTRGFSVLDSMLMQ